jgi:cardiolipin synthase
MPLAAQRTQTFARGLWRIASADVSCGNAVTLLHNGEGTFEEKLRLIEGATDCIDLEAYIFRRDDVGRMFRDALVAAALRGVKVRLLVDWVGRMGTPMSFFDPIRRAGGEVRVFNTPGFRLWLGILPRDHRKLLVVDRAIGVTGGIGIGNEWKKGILRKRHSPWRDTAVRIAGPAVLAMAESFERMWQRAGGQRRWRFREVRGSRASHLDPLHDPPSLVGIVEGEPGRLRVARGLQMQALSADKSIWIASAYFAPSWGVVEALAGAARDGVDVRVLVPSRYDHPWLRTFITPFYERLLRSGVRVWEWRGEMMHAKTSVVDGRWVRVGSTDFNVLGVAINFELDAIIEDRTVGAEAEGVFLRDLEQSREIFVRRSRIVAGPARTAGALLPAAHREEAAASPARPVPVAVEPRLRFPQEDEGDTFELPRR